MPKLLSIALVLAVAGCAVQPPTQQAVSPCAVYEYSYECQVERYHNANVP
jgi:hypothetical protein